MLPLSTSNITETYVLNETQYHKAISGVVSAASIQALIDKEDAESDGSSFWSDVRALSAIFDKLFKTDLIYKSELSAYIATDCEEYKEGEILFGTKSEVINQSFTFFSIYMLRTIIDVIPICTNPEVQAIATDSALVTLGFGYAVIGLLIVWLK